MVLQKWTQLTPFLIEWSVNRMVNGVLLLMTVMNMEHLADSVSVYMSLKLDYWTILCVLVLLQLLIIETPIAV